MRRALARNIKSPLSTVLRPFHQRTLTSMADADCPKAQEPLKEEATCEKPAELPKLSGREFAVYNRMAEGMEYFHNNFRSTWNLMYKACETSKRPSGMSLRQFIQTGLTFMHHLEMHHSIEEQHIFPVLATRMPAFRKELELLTQHKEIHKGMDKMEEYLTACQKGERELRLDELKEVMDTFGTVLWQHLGDEVKQLHAENMRKYWSMDEMRRMPM